MSHEAKPVPVMATEAWEDELSGALRSKFQTENEAADESAALQTVSYRGQPIAIVGLEQYREVIAWMRDEQGFDYLSDLTAVDRVERPLRFEIVAILYSFAANRYVRVKTRAADGVDVPTLCGLYEAANWLEREIFDMFGVRFAGHPNLKRILMPEDWHGYPLRKERGILDMDQSWVQKHLGIESGQ